MDNHDHFKTVYACGHLHSECRHRGEKFTRHLDRPCPECKGKPVDWTKKERFVR